MPEFKDIRDSLSEARKNVEAGKADLMKTKEKLKLLKLSRQNAVRSAAGQSETLAALDRQEIALKKELSAIESRVAGLYRNELTLAHDFQSFSDPRKGVANLSDELPVLLFPVRLETRFKKISDAETGRQLHQLWVRIFPDECSIDTFNETLSQSELKKAQNYWTNRWKAGSAGNEEIIHFIKNKEKGAWRELMGHLNAGRAYWISQHYRPVNEQEIPVRTTENEVFLIIPTEMPPDTPTQNALKDYWQALFPANGNAQTAQAALQKLVSATGLDETKALELAKTFQPVNLKEENAATPAYSVKTVFLIFPGSQSVDTRIDQWSGAARSAALPDRFVLMGYQKGNPEPVINHLGAAIPDPLIVGPDPGEAIDEVLKAAYGEEFEQFSDDEKAEKYIEYLTKQSETKWLFDFEEAVRVGMGFKVNLTEETYNAGFHRLFVMGVKLSASEQESQLALERLIERNHFGDSGFSLVPQGTPTNNTEESASGYSETEDADEAYERYFSENEPEDPSNREERRDGRWLADLLGIDPERSSLNKTANYYHTDQMESRAMNIALWNSTIGYFMESMLTPLFSDWDREVTRWFFLNHTIPRGRIPAIRIGDQPYGILPVSPVSNLQALDQTDTRFHREYSDHLPVLKDIYSILLKTKEEWKSIVEKAAYVGKKGDAHQILLEALGLHASSVEYDQRYAESFLHLFNKLKLEGWLGELLAALLQWDYKKKGMDLLARLGYQHDAKTDPGIPILEKFFLTKENDVNKPPVDDNPLSEKNKIRSYTDDGKNYIEWLIDNALNNHQNIKNQKGFTDNKSPYALLYDMLRHALNLEFANTGLKLYHSHELINPSQVQAAKIDAAFIGVQPEKTEVESKWDLIYRKEPVVAQEGLVVDHISQLIKQQVINPQTRHLHEMIEALERLKDAPTARLERAFAEHIDACAYRLDAWLLGFVNLMLHAMRYGGESPPEQPRQGIYLGAYGWVEDLKPEEKNLTPAELTDEQKEIFDPGGTQPPMEDSANAGYVHAPSVSHALTSAVLRNAYISAASEDKAEMYKVNLSSERVRMALSVIEGMQNGQSFGALLGYQLERGLHDHTTLELDIFIYELRKVFPLVSNRLATTEVDEGNEDFEDEKAISKIEARNVVDGLALLDHIKNNGVSTYPFGFPTGTGAGKLKEADSNQSKAINDEVRRLLNIRDAVADLAMAESVHQVVQGNYDRAAGTLDAYSKGAYPQTPDVIKTPLSGISLTHRFGLHLPAGISVDAGTTPRSKAEPALNKWLEDLLPNDLSAICVNVEFLTPAYDEGPAGPPQQKTVTLADLGLEPVDLIYMLDLESEKSLTALDDCILKFVHESEGLRPDAELKINYTRPVTGKITFFELSPLIRSLRTLTLSARALQPTDMTLQNEAREEQNTGQFIRLDRITKTRQLLEDTRSVLETNFINPLSIHIDPEDFEITMGAKTQIINALDGLIAIFIDQLRALNEFGMPHTGFGFVYDRKKAICAAVYNKVTDYKKRWQQKSDVYDDLLSNQFPAAATDEEKLAILQKAERTISTESTVPVPTVADYLVILNGGGSEVGKKKLFDDKYDELENFLNTGFSSLKALIDGANALNTGINLFDPELIDFTEDERQVVVLAEDLLTQASKLNEELLKRVASTQKLIDEHNDSSDGAIRVKKLVEAAKIMFGEDFQVIPEFMLDSKQGSEIKNCIDNRDALLDYQINTQANDFPVDEWLYGVARVREKLAAWENAALLAEGIKDRTPLDLTPLQFPFKPGDAWLGLEYPEDLEIGGEKLLYTAYLPSFDPAQPQCGLLVDEWTEVIPAKKETTGLSFHYDRPNCEAPQSWLLVTPSAFTGQWNWSDLVNSLHETLDLARLRAVEPDHIDQTDYAQFLPATVAAVTMYPVTMMLNYALKSVQINGGENG